MLCGSFSLGCLSCHTFIVVRCFATRVVRRPWSASGGRRLDIVDLDGIVKFDVRGVLVLLFCVCVKNF